MKDKPGSSDKKGGKEKRTIVEMSVTPADAERLKKAFADGLLEKYGVTEIEFDPAQKQQPGKKQWTPTKRRNRGAARDDDTLSEPSR